jgi:hypothetical protein
MSRTFVIVLLLILTALSASSGSHAQQLGPSFWKNECETPWGTIIYGGESVTAYQSATGDACTGCVSETRTCAGDRLSGTYTNQSCASAGTCVFVTGGTGTGDEVMSIEAANFACASRADNAGLSGTYLAWIATSASDDPESRFVPSSSPYYLPNGTKVADNWADLTDGTLDAAINLTETGGPPAAVVWTAVGSNGTASGVDCTDWGSSSGSGTKGSTSSTTSTWTSNSTQSCSSQAALYCFQCVAGGLIWEEFTSRGGGPGAQNWTGVASSADGVNLVAVASGDYIYTSEDSGLSWWAHNSPRSWTGVASSSDGVKLVAVVVGGQIYTSTNSGVNWTARASNRDWKAVASSADGVKLVAVVDGGQIYTSTDSGVSWTARDSNRSWQSVASSDDGTKLVAVAAGDNIFTSTDSGVTWTSRETTRLWTGVASSSDGTKLVASTSLARVYTSTDSGVTWTSRDSIRDWTGVASSADGVKLVAVVNGGQIYTSTNSGVTWTARESSRSWEAVASSSDGTMLVAVDYGGQIYRSSCTTGFQN